MAEGEVVCTFSRRRKLYTFRIVDGKKVRIPNEFAEECQSLPECGSKSKLCAGKQRLPCKKKLHIFNSTADVKQYCGVVSERPKGEYGRSDRADIAATATKKLGQPPTPRSSLVIPKRAPSKSKGQVRFANQRTIFV